MLFLFLSIGSLWVRSLVGLEGIHDVGKAADHQDAKQCVPEILQHPFPSTKRVQALLSMSRSIREPTDTWWRIPVIDRKEVIGAG
jgi:hypothetical protein